MKKLARLCTAAGTAAVALATLNVCAATAEPGLIQRGQYLAAAGDCIACHTSPGGKPMAGGLPLDTPIGPVISTNITPSRTHGIGNYTLEQFSNALRKGIRADGSRLYPAMPYTSYAIVVDDDVKALYAYFMQGVQAVDAAPARRTDLPFPFNVRLSMAGWNLLFLDGKPFQPDAGKSAEWNRGAYLARGLAHCSACHSPRGMLMAEQSSRELAGADIGPWYAPNITSDSNSGIGGWSEKELIDYLHSGRASGKAQAAGPMVEAIDNSLRHLTEADTRAIATYLKRVPAQRDAADTRPVYAWGTAADELNSIRGVPLPVDRNQMTGPQLYDAHCATCHQAHGEGSFDGSLPPLFHNTALGRSNTNNLVMVLLDGIQRQADAPEVLMPGFKQVMSDQQIAMLGTYLEKSYGNPAALVTAAQVKALRGGGAQSNLTLLAQGGMGVVIVVLLGAVFAFSRSKPRSIR
jgi:mono/diheme cytochrome c family protein